MEATDQLYKVLTKRVRAVRAMRHRAISRGAMKARKIQEIEEAGKGFGMSPLNFSTISILTNTIKTMDGKKTVAIVHGAPTVPFVAPVIAEVYDGDPNGLTCVLKQHGLQYREGDIA